MFLKPTFFRSLLDSFIVASRQRNQSVRRAGRVSQFQFAKRWFAVMPVTGLGDWRAFSSGAVMRAC